MMNHHMPAGSGQPHLSPVMSMHHPPRGRQQEYHYHHHHHPQQAPMHMSPYQTYQQPAPFYPHPPPYQPQRWHPQYPPQHFTPPPQMQQQQQQQQQQYQPRSPLVVSSQPHASMNQVTRQTTLPSTPQPLQATHSPRPMSHHMQQHQHQQQQHHQHQHRQHQHQQHQHQQQPPPPPPQQQQQLLQQQPLQQQQTTVVPNPPTAPPEVVTKTEETSDSPVPSARRPSTALNPLSLPPEYKQPYWPSLPWYSVPEDKTVFNSRASQQRRKRRNLCTPAAAVALPKRDGAEEESTSFAQVSADVASESSTIAAPSDLETPATSLVPSESEFNQASTPTTPAPVTASSPKPASSQHQHARRDTRTAIAVPNLASFPKSKDALPSSAPHGMEVAQSVEQTLKSNGASPDAHVVEGVPEDSATPQTPPSKPAPKSWADLVRRNTSGASSATLPDGTLLANGTQLSKSASLADALRQYSVQNDTTLSFLEPRGLVNTGNMCYMNSILQVLVFCAPFYTFLDQVRQRTVHSMKSDTPLLDAMIMFMREFKVLAGADSSGALRATLTPDQVELYGDPVTPEYVYDVIRKLPRFAGMRRGHQQDAEEFLGFLLEGLHDECVHVMQAQPEEESVENSVTSPTSIMSPGSADGWLEVGPKQKASVTRTAGQQDAPSPVTKIFGGHLRSELRVSGLKDSVTLEPYKPLQLDIGAQNVNNIIDALKGLTRTEVLSGDFGGRGDTAKKQVFIDTLPPVLILHLKRFQYDNNLTGTQKIWKKVGYPLELEIPKDVFPPSKRGGLAVKGGLPKYRLSSVVYHHGKSAAGGHYTVDVLRQDGREWVRMDDTIIRRIRPDDVAEGGSEEDPKILARALEQHRADQELQKQRNMYQGLDEDVADEDKPWSEVNGLPGNAKKWSGVAVAAAATNGTATPSSTTGKRTPTARKEGVRDNKVAYILLYERIRD